MTREEIAILVAITAVVVSLPLQAGASPIEYRFSGLLTGDLGQVNPVSLIDVPFEIAIQGDSDAAFEFGYVAGFGRTYVNAGVAATWVVDGFGTATVASAQVYSIPGIASVGFGWNGEIFPLDTTDPAERQFGFLGNPFAFDPDYSRLSTAVPPIPIDLLTHLENPPGVMPVYTTSIYFPGQGSLVLKDLSSLSYTVVSIPEPSAATLLLLGPAGLSTGLWMSRARRRIPVGD